MNSISDILHTMLKNSDLSKFPDLSKFTSDISINIFPSNNMNIPNNMNISEMNIHDIISNLKTIISPQPKIKKVDSLSNYISRIKNILFYSFFGICFYSFTHFSNNIYHNLNHNNNHNICNLSTYNQNKYDNNYDNNYNNNDIYMRWTGYILLIVFGIILYKKVVLSFAFLCISLFFPEFNYIFTREIPLFIVLSTCILYIIQLCRCKITFRHILECLLLYPIFSFFQNISFSSFYFIILSLFLISSYFIHGTTFGFTSHTFYSILFIFGYMIIYHYLSMIQNTKSENINSFIHLHSDPNINSNLYKNIYSLSDTSTPNYIFIYSKVPKNNHGEIIHNDISMSSIQDISQNDISSCYI